jgi:predicted dehydrogenase
MAHVRIGLLGWNGHQLPWVLPAAVRARVIGAVRDEAQGARAWPDGVRRYADLDGLLADPEIDLVSLCSARRLDQAAQALRCFAAGKHVLAEKPCAFDVATLETLLAAARRSGRRLFEMAASELAPALQAIRRLVADGTLGEIVHVQAHKSYPWHARRPADEAVDGGLVRQVGIHAVRFVQGATGLRMVRVQGKSTAKGGPLSCAMRMAAAFVFELENGGIGTINLNYLNPSNFGAWGNDQLRVFGTRGMAETVDGFRRHALYAPERGESTELPFPDDLVSPLYIEHVANHLLDGRPMPTAFEDEMAMTRAMLAMAEADRRAESVAVVYPDRP